MKKVDSATKSIYKSIKNKSYKQSFEFKVTNDYNRIIYNVYFLESIISIEHNWLKLNILYVTFESNLIYYM
jgi:hypothetical protein